MTLTNALFVIEGPDGTVFIEGGDEIIFISERGDPGVSGTPGLTAEDVDARFDALTDGLADEISGRETAVSDLSDVVDGVQGTLEAADTAEALLRGSGDDDLQTAIDAEETLRVAQTAALAAANVAQDAARAATEAALTASIAAENVRALAAEALLVPKTWRGAANGVAPLDGNQLVPDANIPAAIARDAEVANSLTAEAARADAYANAAVTQAKADLINGAGTAFDTLLELAAAMGNDPNFAATMTGLIGAKQDGSAQLSALAALVFAANEMVYATGPGAFAKATLTVQARALLDDADAPTMRGTLGLGSSATHAAGDFDVAGAAGAAQAAAIAASQPASALLGLLAALAPAADQMPYFTAANAVAMADVTAFARSLMDDISAVAMRGTLGLGTAATHDHGDYDTAGSAFAAQTAAIAASQPLAALLTNLVALAPGANTIPYINGAGAWAAASVTAAARSILDDATVADIRVTLGLGTAATHASTDYVLKANAFSMLYGDASDGAAVLDGATAVAWANRVGNVYTMTRACFLTDLTINAGVTLRPAQFPVYGSGTLTNNGTIQNNGNDAVADVGGAAGTFNYLVGGTKGGNGGAVNGAGAAGTAGTSAAGAGGNGGAGQQAAGAAGVLTALTAGFSGFHQPQTWLNLQFLSAAGNVTFAGGIGGGGGGGSTLAKGGGAGGGGGVIALLFRHIVNAGVIEAKGGAGANAAASATNGGGGGGGGGGLIATLGEDYAGAGTWVVTGGAKGLKVNAGADGTDGSAGTVVHTVIPA